MIEITGKASQVLIGSDSESFDGRLDGARLALLIVSVLTELGAKDAHQDDSCCLSPLQFGGATRSPKSHIYD